MGCNDYNLHLEGSEGNESSTPEYKIYLDGVGVNGYSPTVDIVNENTASFQIQTNDINGSELTSPIPKLSYLQSDYVSNTSLASTLAGYLQVDGSNADNPITINGHTFESLYSGLNTKLAMTGSPAYIEAPILVLRSTNTGKVYYKSSNVNNELATIGDISDATITLTQGGVTKGTFTLNGSATTIDLDAGGGSITNPLTLISTDGTRSLTLGINNSNNKLQSTYNFISGGSTFSSPIYLLAGKTDPITLTDDDYGKYTIGLNIDNTTIKVNQQTGELYAVGGGGTTYTAGTGIDITGGVISVKDIQEFNTVTLANTIGNNGEGLYGTTADGSSTLPLVRIDSLDSTLFGNTTSDLYLFGDNTRPYYNNSTNTLALYSDIPTVPTITTGSSNGTISVGGTDIAVYGLGSAAYTSSSDYVDLTTDQNIAGIKAFIGTLRLISGSTVIRNSANTGNVGAITSDTTSLIISTPASNLNINLKPNGTGEVQYNGTKVATVNDIPSISNLADKDLSNLSTTGQDIIDGKADTDLSNITTVGKGVIATNSALSSTKHVDIALIAGSGNTYVSHVNGFVCFCVFSGTATWCQLSSIDYSDTNQILIAGVNVAGIIYNMMPVYKGQKYKINYDGSIGNPIVFREISLEGDTVS